MMDWQLIAWMISVSLWWGYVIWFISKFGIPFSWSSTFYTLKSSYGRNTGWIILGAEWGYSLPLIPILFEKNPLIALCAILIAFIASAANYRDGKLPYIVHMACSISTVALAIILFGIVYHLWLFSIPFALITALLFFKKIKLKNDVMWIETLTMLAGHIIILIKDIL